VKNPTNRRPLAWFGPLSLAAVLVACTSSGSPTASTSVLATASASASAGGSASVEPTTQPTTEPTVEPTDGLGEFACSFPVNGIGTVTRAQITDVRVGRHDGYDRVVFEFDLGIPQFTLDEETPPLVQDPSGLEMDVAGSAFWQLVMHGGTRVTPDGEITYRGPLAFKPDFPKLAELSEGGDFEAVSTWYVGLDSEACVRVLTLTDPARLVIDIGH
jgi:hypothetical protein